MEIKITNANFQAEVIESDKPVLIDFYATWCGPCKMLAPILEGISEESDALIGKINVDDEPELASLFEVSSIPTLVVLKDGKIVSRSSGARPKPFILQMLED